MIKHNVVKFKKNGITHFRRTCGVCENEVSYKHMQLPDRCVNPLCPSNLDEDVPIDYWLKPPIEVKLFFLQREYYSNLDIKLFESFGEEIKKAEKGLDYDEKIIEAHNNQVNKDVLFKIYSYVKVYSDSLLKKFIKSKSFYLTPMEYEEALAKLVFIWYELYTKSPKGRIRSSWGGLLNKKIKQALYTQAKDDQNSSLDGLINSNTDSQQATTLEDMANCFNIKFFMTNDKTYYDPYEDNKLIINELYKVFLKLYSKIRKDNNYSNVINSLIAFNLFIKKDNKKLYYLYESCGNKLKVIVERSKTTLRKYLRQNVLTRVEQTSKDTSKEDKSTKESKVC